MALNLISLGAGVQSSTIALMAAAGEITPMPEGAIFADTGSEPPSVYNWLKWLAPQLPFPVYTVGKATLAQDGLEIRRSKKSGRVYLRSLIPLFVKNADGKKGILMRKCTRDYKIAPIQRKAKELAGMYSIDGKVNQWIGISVDEASRMRDSDKPWLRNRYPLIEANMSRADCLAWMASHGYPTPPRSACTFCPYHSDAEWLRLKTEEPEAFAEAVAYEQQCQSAAARQEVLRGEPFLHSSLVPLTRVVFNPTVNKHAMVNECSGICGV